jgi:hypothetical protein
VRKLRGKILWLENPFKSFFTINIVENYVISLKCLLSRISTSTWFMTIVFAFKNKNENFSFSHQRFILKWNENLMGIRARKVCGLQFWIINWINFLKYFLETNKLYFSCSPCLFLERQFSCVQNQKFSRGKLILDSHMKNLR